MEKGGRKGYITERNGRSSWEWQGIIAFCTFQWNHVCVWCVTTDAITVSLHNCILVIAVSFVWYDILVVSLRYKSSRMLHHFIGSNLRYFKGLYCLIYGIKQSEKSSHVSQRVCYILYRCGWKESMGDEPMRR